MTTADQLPFRRSEADLLRAEAAAGLHPTETCWSCNRLSWRSITGLCAECFALSITTDPATIQGA